MQESVPRLVVHPFRSSHHRPKSVYFCVSYQASAEGSSTESGWCSCGRIFRRMNRDMTPESRDAPARFSQMPLRPKGHSTPSKITGNTRAVDTEITEAGKRKEVERKIFPGYVIVKMVMTDESWYAVRNIRGCTGFVGPSSKPIPLTEDEVARLGIENKEVEVSYKVGDSVNIVDGPLEGFIGTVEEMDVEKNRVRVTVSMFGRETPVELELDQAEPVD